MDQQALITFGIGILVLACFLGTMIGVQRFIAKTKDPGKALKSADDIVDTAMLANDTLKPIIPAPVEGIIDIVLKATQAGVHSAEQLYQCNQLPPDLRKDKASEYAINMIKLTGREVTPELEQSIRDAAEGAVFIMKQQQEQQQKAQKEQAQKAVSGVSVQEQRSQIIQTDTGSSSVIVN